MVNGTQGNSERDILSVKLRQLTQVHDMTVERVDELNDRLLDPDRGLFTKVKDIDQRNEDLTEKMENFATGLNTLVEVCQTQTSRTAELENQIEKNDERDKLLRDSVATMAKSITPLGKDYERRMGIKKWTDKIIWAILALLIGAIATDVKKVFEDNKKLENVENLMKRQEQRALKRIPVKNRTSNKKK